MNESEYRGWARAARRSMDEKIERLAKEGAQAARPPPQGEANLLMFTHEQFDAALRQRADEATRNENIGCAALVERLLQRAYPMDSAYEPIVAAIRARIKP